MQRCACYSELFPSQHLPRITSAWKLDSYAQSYVSSHSSAFRCIGIHRAFRQRRIWFLCDLLRALRDGSFHWSWKGSSMGGREWSICEQYNGNVVTKDVWYNGIQYNEIQWNIIPCNAIQLNPSKYNAIQSKAIQDNAIKLK